MRTIHVIALLAAALAGTGPALAQGSPSADSIINSLRPSSVGGGTRGLRMNPVPDASAPAPATPASAGRAVGRPAPIAAPSVSMTVQFASNSAELTPAAMRTLDELGRALTSQALSGYKFRIEGHTDTVGTREHNLALSQDRAAKVVDYLASKFGVDRTKIEPVGIGPDQPVVHTGANVPEQRNRRVTVVNLGT